MRDSRIENAQRDDLFVYVTLSMTFYDSICDTAALTRVNRRFSQARS